MSEHTYTDMNEKDLLELMEELISKGFIVFVKWTCENCSERATCNEPNAFFTKGFLHEDCSHISYPKKFGLLAIRRLK
jgi:hypothetical protein